MSSDADLLALTAELVAFPSESRSEGPFVDWLEEQLASCDHLRLTRVGQNLVARTELGRAQRVVLAGHTDTVPAAEGPFGRNDRPRLDGDTLWGVGSSDMKGGLAVMLQLALAVPRPLVDVTYVFYAREEIAAAESGLGELIDADPDLVRGDCAILGEPTAGAVEAGCQGTMRLELRVAGARAHTARAWMGSNAIHRLAPIVAAIAEYEPRMPELAGCTYHEALQIVAVEGGVAGNVVPDTATLLINHRFAPDRSAAEAESHVRSIIEPLMADGDRLTVVDVASGAPPGVDHPLLARVVDSVCEVRAKLGWTDVARFAAIGVPAINLGPGDPTVAHMADERVERWTFDAPWRALSALLTEEG